MRILANDGISAAGKEKLEANGFEVVTDKVDQADLAKGINEGGFVGVLVRSATQVRKEHMDACPNLKLIGRGGVGMDNIDVQYGRDKGLHVINTPAASSQSVAELALANMFALSRFTYDAARQMPGADGAEFKGLKKSYGKGTELRGKTLGIIGFGGIGKTLASYALGCGMNVVYNTRGDVDTESIPVEIGSQTVNVDLTRTSMDEVLEKSDFISLHVPRQDDGSAVIGAAELARSKDGVCIINTARGGSVDEDALIAAIDEGKVKGAALDVFVGEPNAREDVLNHPKILSTPHIGGSTVEAQARIGVELADQIIRLLK